MRVKKVDPRSLIKLETTVKQGRSFLRATTERRAETLGDSADGRKLSLRFCACLGGTRLSIEAAMLMLFCVRRLNRQGVVNESFIR